MNRWTLVRVILIAVGAVFGTTLWRNRPISDAPLDLSFLLLIIFGTPSAVLFVVGLQALNPRSATVWRPMSWSINPFLFKEPLQFFHAGAFHFMAGGLMACLPVLWGSRTIPAQGVFILVIGVMTWASLYLCTRVFRRKMESPAGSDATSVLPTRGKKRFRIVVIVAILVVVAWVASYVFIINSEPYRVATTFIATNQQVIENLGPVRSLRLSRSNYSYMSSGGYGTFTIRVKGENEKGTVRITLGQSGDGTWKIDRLLLELDSGKIVHIAV